MLPLGLPESSLPAVIGDLAANNATALAMVEGVTPEIIGAGVGGLFEAYSLGFRFVWVAAGCFTVIAAVCKFSLRSLFPNWPVFQNMNRWLGCWDACES